MIEPALFVLGFVVGNALGLVIGRHLGRFYVIWSAEAEDEQKD